LQPEDTAAERERDARVPDDWFVGFHRGLAARFWRAAGAAMAEDDARVVLALLALPAGASVLDVPCGDGRLTVRLALAGLDAVGVDIAAEELERARRAAARAGAPARFAVGDLRRLPDLGRFDAVLTWGNSFGYLPPRDTARSLEAMRHSLRPGGRLVLESLTVAESLLVGGVQERAEYEFGGVRMVAANRYRPSESRLESDFTFEDGAGAVEHARAAHHVHTAGEVVRMLRGAGFAEVELLGGGDGTAPYALGSRRMVAVAKA
jgi:SAM-dependent methyltransferase